MPKVVDHDDRRANLAAAVWRVIGRTGIESATVRAVAAEAGVSPGSLRHYFSDQAGLVRFATNMMAQRAVERLRQQVKLGGRGPDAGELIVQQMLPLDADREVEAAVRLEALTQARFDPQLARLKESRWFSELHICRIAWATARDLEPPTSPTATFSDNNDELAAEQLHTYIDGLTLQAATFPEQLSPADVTRRLKQFFSLLLLHAGDKR